MYLLRPSQMNDSNRILALAQQQGVRQAGLPKTNEALSHCIQQSEESFRVSNTIKNQLWVLETLEQNSIVGTIAVEACTGQAEPFYSYRRETLINASYRLKVKEEIPVLYQSHELAGCTQIHSMTLLPEHRNQAALCTMIQGVLLYIAEYSQSYCPKLLIEFPGFKDERGHSPLWNDLGQHFFQMTLEQACFHASIEDKALIAQLMPNHPLYQNLLSSTCQSTLGEPQQDLSDYYQLFMLEGFTPSQHVDIFDGGPCLVCDTRTNFSVNENRRIKLADYSPPDMPHIIASNRQDAKALYIDPSIKKPLSYLQNQLALSEQDWLRWVPAHQEVRT